MDVQGTAFEPFPLTTIYANFQTGQQVTGVEASNNYTAYAAQLAKYPYLLYSWNLPSPVPSDLLLPFAEFIAKYDLQDVAYSLFQDGEGFDNFLNELTINIFKLVDESFLDAAAPGGSIVPPNHDNGAIYTQAAAQLGSDVLLSSTVVDAQRPPMVAPESVWSFRRPPARSSSKHRSFLLASRRSWTIVSGSSSHSLPLVPFKPPMTMPAIAKSTSQL